MDVPARYITFEGKQDLEKQLERRIRGYLNPNARFIVLRDLDSNPNCKKLKTNLLAKVNSTGKTAQILVRIACQELEAFLSGRPRSRSERIKHKAVGRPTEQEAL